jgi:hypothetical protein
VDEKKAVVRVVMKICIALTSVPVGQKSLLVKTRNKAGTATVTNANAGKNALVPLTAIKRLSRFLTDYGKKN